MRIDDENYVTVRQRQRNAFEKQLEGILKQYSVVKVADGNGAHHGEDYIEMKQTILDILCR